jgi:hypothetical protein
VLPTVYSDAGLLTFLLEQKIPIDAQDKDLQVTKK